MMFMKAIAYEVRAEPDTVLRSLGSAIAPEMSSNLFYLDNVDTELVGLTDRPGRLSVRRRRDLFSGFSGALRLDLTVTKADGGSRVVGRYRLGSLALMFRWIYVVFFAAFGGALTGLTVSQGTAFLCGGGPFGRFSFSQTPPRGRGGE